MAVFRDLSKIKEIIRLSRQAFGKYKWQIVILTVLGFLSGILGGIGINAIIPLFSFIAGASGQGDDIISQYIVKFFNFINIDFTLKYLLIFIVLLFIFKTIVLIIFSYVSVRITSGYEEQTRTRLFKATLKANWSYLFKQKLGHLEKVLMINVQHSTGLFSQISTLIMTAASLIAYTIVAINISAFMTFLTFGLSSLLFFIYRPLMRKVREISYETEKVNRDIAHYVNENIIGMKTVKVMAENSRIGKIGAKYFNKVRSISIRSYIISIFTGSLMEPLSIIFIAIVFAISYKTSPQFNFAALVAVMYLIKQIFLYISQIQDHVVGMNANLPYLKSILNYETETAQNKEISRGDEKFIFNKTLEFKDLYFSYVSGKEVLSDIDFKINKGEMVGLVGPSGAGKTTIVDIILRLFNPLKGRILLDGKDINQMNLKEWRKNIGYVSQDIFLLNDTIANNIRFYDDSISDKDIEKATKMADIYDFIQSCPDGYNTQVGDRGLMLSGGQRQRVIIARVLARKPKLLILDEATSALDNESERKIKKVIENIKGGITVFAIAHRLSTVINSDRLIVLEKGKITGQGVPQELLEDKKSYFTKMYNLRE